MFFNNNGNRIQKTEAGETVLFINRFYEKNITSGNFTTSYYLGSRLIAQREGTELRYIHQYHLSGTSLTTSENGTVISSIKYFPYGETRSGDAPTDVKFTGQRLDSGTGLYYYGARYYDPLIGRFISADTAAPDPYNPQSRNKYSYCFNNPLKYVDPSGNWPKFLDDAVSWVADKVEVVTEAVGTFVTENIDTIQTGLDIAGMIPVVGEAFDAVNGAIYAARGDYLNAGLSFASCIPVAGTVVGAVAIGVKGVIKGADALSTVVKTTKKVSSFVKLENGYDTFRQAKKAFIDINGPIKKGNEVHHIVEQAQVSSKYAGFNPKLVNNTDNLKSIDKATHRKVTGYYNSKQNFTSDQTVRKWLSTQSFDAQYEYGKSILAMYGHY